MKKTLLLIAFMSSMLLQAQQISPSQPLVQTNGEGIVKIVPDQVLIKSRIEHDGKDPQEVKRLNDAAVSEVIQYLKSQGISERNIQTDYINLNKNYNYDNKTYSYVSNQAISILLEDLTNYEKIMSGLLEAGLNRIDGIEFKSSEIDKYNSEARKRAVMDAKMKAEEYAGALNQSVGKAVSINEIEAGYHQPVYRMNEMMKTSDAVEESIAPGELEIKAKVIVGFILE